MKSRRNRLTLVAAFVAVATSLCIAEPSRATSVRYTVTPLGTLGGTITFARGINDNGHVTGDSLNSSGKRRAFLYDGISINNLGTIGGEGNRSQGYGINNSGQVTGDSEFDSSADRHTILYDGTTMNDLGNRTVVVACMKWRSLRTTVLRVAMVWCR